MPHFFFKVDVKFLCSGLNLGRKNLVGLQVLKIRVVLLSLLDVGNLRLQPNVLDRVLFRLPKKCNLRIRLIDPLTLWVR